MYAGSDIMKIEEISSSKVKKLGVFFVVKKTEKMSFNKKF